MILRVVDEALAARAGGIAVTVIGFAGQRVVGVEGKAAWVEARERRCLRGPVADRVKVIADAAILVRRIVRGRFVCQTVRRIVRDRFAGELELLVNMYHVPAFLRSEGYARLRVCQAHCASMLCFLHVDAAATLGYRTVTANRVFFS